MNSCPEGAFVIYRKDFWLLRAYQILETIFWLLFGIFLFMFWWARGVWTESF